MSLAHSVRQRLLNLSRKTAEFQCTHCLDGFLFRRWSEKDSVECVYTKKPFQYGRKKLNHYYRGFADFFNATCFCIGK